MLNGNGSSELNPSGLQGICPDGWHVPSQGEWIELFNYVASQSDNLCDENSAYYAKALTSKSGWYDSNVECAVGNNQYNNNHTGFGVLPAGYYDSYHDYYGGFGQEGYFHSTTTEEQSGMTCYSYYGMDYSSAKIKIGFDCYYDLALSVRCVRNAESGGGGGGSQTDGLIHLDEINGDLEAVDGDILTGELASNYKISIADGATVTLQDVIINGVNDDSYDWAGITCAGDATIILEGTNTVKGFYEDYPGIYVGENKTLIIQGTGTLYASSNGAGAGIGGGVGMGCGDIMINDGTIYATGAPQDDDFLGAAGIGSGAFASCGTITIDGGTVTAIGGFGAAGIGSGQDAYCGSIAISGGTVTAEGGDWAAGIGSGRCAASESTCDDIIISGGEVTAIGGQMGAGIGSGLAYAGNSTCGTISISGGVVTATGGQMAAGIGSGLACGDSDPQSTCGTIEITGGSVTATGGSDGDLYSVYPEHIQCV